MRTLKLFVLACIAAVSIYGCSTPAVDPIGPDVPVTPEDPEEPVDTVKIAAHPRLFIPEAGLSVPTGVLAPFHKTVIGYADDSVSGKDAAPSYTFDSSNLRILTTASIPALRQLLACAYAYKTTKQSKYLNKAKGLILLVCSFKDWNASKHALDAAEMALGVATAYDWLYDALDAATRQKAENALYDFALAPHLAAWDTNGTWKSGGVSLNYLTATNNWNQVCCSGVTAAALAVYDLHEEECERIISQCAASVKRQTASMYGTQGNYPEGPAYWAYGTGYQCLMAAALKSATGTTKGVDSNGWWSKTPTYELFVDDLSTDMQFNYCDAAQTSSLGTPMLYFAAALDNSTLMYNEIAKADLYKSNKYEGRVLPAFLAMVSGMDAASVSTPEGTLYIGDGVQPIAVARMGWTGKESDRYLGLKGGTAYASHAHMDVGSFVYDAGGVRWSCDPGTNSYTSYETAASSMGGAPSGSTQESLRWWVNVYNNKHHSTLSVADAQGNPIFHKVGSNAARATVKAVTSGGKTGASVDWSGSGTFNGLLASAKRTAVLTASGDCEITDELTAPSSSDVYVQWRMLTAATPSVSSSGIRLAQSGKTLKVSAVVSDSSIVPSWSTFPVLHESYTWKGNTYPDTWDLSCLSDRSLAGFTVRIPAGKSVSVVTTLALQ